MKDIAAIFTRKPEPEAPKPEPKGGLDVLRARAKAHARLPQGASWLKEALRISGAELDAFLSGGPARFEIPLLIDYLGMRCEYLPDFDLLRSTAPPPTTTGNAYAPLYEAKPFVPSTSAIGLGCYPPPLYSRPPGASKPAVLPQPGWAAS